MPVTQISKDGHGENTAPEALHCLSLSLQRKAAYIQPWLSNKPSLCYWSLYSLELVNQNKNVLHVLYGLTTIFESSHIITGFSCYFHSVHVMWAHYNNRSETDWILNPTQATTTWFNPRKNITHWCVCVCVWHRCVSNNMLMLIRHWQLTPMTKHKTHDKSLEP